MGLGSCELITLAEARDRAREFRKQIMDGVNPIEERRTSKARAGLRAAKTKTFKECAESYIDANRAGWKHPRHAKQWENTLETYAYPIIGGLPVSAIDTGLVLEVLQQPVETTNGTAPFWNVKTETAARVRGRMESDRKSTRLNSSHI
jgi:hypothetical protein